MCEAATANGANTRLMLARLFASGREAVAARHRLAICTHATQCGRICERLTKAPGVSQVRCVDLEAGTSIDLYEAIAQPSFACPLGRF